MTEINVYFLTSGVKDQQLPTSNYEQMYTLRNYASNVTVSPEALKPLVGDGLELSEAVASSAPLLYMYT